MVREKRSADVAPPPKAHCGSFSLFFSTCVQAKSVTDFIAATVVDPKRGGTAVCEIRMGAMPTYERLKSVVQIFMYTLTT